MFTVACQIRSPLCSGLKGFTWNCDELQKAILCFLRARSHISMHVGSLVAYSILQYAVPGLDPFQMVVRATISFSLPPSSPCQVSPAVRPTHGGSGAPANQGHIDTDCSGKELSRRNTNLLEAHFPVTAVQCSWLATPPQHSASQAFVYAQYEWRWQPTHGVARLRTRCCSRCKRCSCM